MATISRSCRVNTASGEIDWVWEPRDDGGTVGTPILGFRAPADGSIVVALDLDGSVVHTLLSSEGTPLAGFGTGTEFIPPGGVFSGWFDTGVASYVSAADDVFELTAIDVTDLATSRLASFGSTLGLRQVWSTGDGTNVMAITSDESWLYDVTRQARGRTLSRGCGTTVLEGPLT